MADRDGVPLLDGLATDKEDAARRRVVTARDLALWAVAGTVLTLPLIIYPWMTRRAVKRMGKELEAAIKSSSSRAESAIFRLQSHQDAASTSIRRRMDGIDLRTSNDSRIMRNLVMERIRASNELERKVDALRRRLLEAQADHSNLDELQRASNRAMLNEIERIWSRLQRAKQASSIMARSLGSSLANIAAFMNELELQLGFPRIGQDPRGIEKLRRLALDLEHACGEDLSGARPREPFPTVGGSPIPNEDSDVTRNDEAKEDEESPSGGSQVRL